MTATQSPPVLTAQQLAEAFALNTHIIARQTDGLTHADSLIQPPFRGNCLNWVLGHIAVHRDFILVALGEERVLGEEPVARYDFGSEPVLGEGEGVLPLETLLAAISQTQERIAAALAEISETELARNVPWSDEETVAELVASLFWHDTYHTGQTELLRQLAGKNDKVL